VSDLTFSAQSGIYRPWYSSADFACRDLFHVGAAEQPSSRLR